MKTRKRKILSILMCMSMLVLCAIPVMAAECTHTNKLRDKMTIYESISAGQHNICLYERITCRACGKLIETYTEVTGTESHSLTYDDLGHTNGAHNYRISCTKCSFSQVTSIPCSGGGSHSTP